MPGRHGVCSATRHFTFCIEHKMNGDSVSKSIARPRPYHATQHDHQNPFFFRTFRLFRFLSGSLLVHLLPLILLILWLTSVAMERAEYTEEMYSLLSQVYIRRNNYLSHADRSRPVCLRDM